MGLLRTILAIAVVFAHLPFGGSFVFIGGLHAVQLFYFISGYLIAHVIATNKSYENPLKFYLNRILRIYPIYLAVAFLSLLYAILINQKFLDLYQNIPASADALLIFSNLFIFGQDWVMFSGVNEGHLVATSDFKKSDFLLHTGLLVPQAWTLGVELSFYALAPYVLRDKKMIFVLLILSLSIRWFLFNQGLGNRDPWNYRFFPAELSLFLMGALSNQYLLPFWRKIISLAPFRALPRLATYLVICLVVFYFRIPVNEAIKGPLLFSVFLLFMPLTFLYQSTSKIDQAIGELSYPIYICHLLIIRITNDMSERLNIFDHFGILCACLFMSLMFAYLLNRHIGDRIEQLRTKIRGVRIKTANQPLFDRAG
ncbi:acyltransferase [Sulfuricella denitrificans skB26]|uniref:Acyltransferase n=1 Tax=Sulfuricella denitrificans (strain DSM 22764 / NBRC 105220 / skB26) TaxID=1163617 RepID=S6B6T8_SULDS|nr:acyltransferase [Sulfuricella denitrificans]BAN36207.1 acyltransferase [Sulfuricella denitrificans skB26]